MPVILRNLLIVCLVSLYTAAPVLADNLKAMRVAVATFEAQGKWNLAYPLALFLAKKDNTYQAWSQLAAKYADSDTTGENYLQAWRLAAKLDHIDTYQDFLTIRTDTVIDLHAIRAIYRLTRATNDISKLAWFIEIYPDTMEAIEAVLAIHELAFAKAKERDNPEIYDAFIATFPEAKQVPEAMELAFQVELRQLQAENAKLNVDDPAARERLARKILTKGRKAEYAANNGRGTEAPEHPGHIVPIIAARDYKLIIEFTPFEDTETVISVLDRHERIAYQKLLLQHLDGVANKIEAAQDAILNALTAQTAAIDAQREQLSADIQHQTGVIKAVGERLATEMHNQTTTLTGAIDRVTVAIDQVGKEVKTQGERITAAVNNVGIMIDTHNQLMDKQLALIQNPSAVLETHTPGGEQTAGVADSVVAGGVATACEYAGKIAGGVAGAYASGGTAAVVGSQVGAMASRYACEAIGKLADKVKAKAKELAEKAKAKIAAVTKPVVNKIKQAGRWIKNLFSGNEAGFLYSPYLALLYN